ncbi:hypothetical protein [Pseudonocardia sediminis]|uniref:hypothetical protein n=1 Tax=Pseudonocardia sediminis TaxID=1397368 RepID=UPI001A9367AB|nr:hypothetical protein [Pseudonocardia sediminis]
MTTTLDDAATTLDALRGAVDGDVIGARDDGYDEARSLWNAEQDRRPLAVVRATSPADVAAALRVAQDRAPAWAGWAARPGSRSTTSSGPSW